MAILIAASLIALVPHAVEAQKRQKDLITYDDIIKLAKADLDLLTAIKLIKPEFLDKPRGTRTLGGGVMNPILVVVGNRRGDSQLLEQLRALDVKEVRYLEPSRAQDEYGIRANGGALIVKLVNDKDKGPG